MLNAHTWKAELRAVPRVIRKTATNIALEAAPGRGIFTDVRKIHDIDKINSKHLYMWQIAQEDANYFQTLRD